MKKLLTLIGAITLTTTVSAVTIVSCGMRTNAIEFTIGGEKELKDIKGNPLNLMMNISELLNFHKEKYNTGNAGNDVVETLGKYQSENFNLYALSKAKLDSLSQTDNSSELSKYENFDNSLNSLNNDGTKSFDISWGDNKPKEIVAVDELKFAVIRQEFDKDKNGAKPVMTESNKSYDEILKDKELWGLKDDETETETSKIFENTFKDLKMKVIGDWTPSNVTDVNSFILEDGKNLSDFDRKFITDSKIDYVSAPVKEGEVPNYTLDILQEGLNPLLTEKIDIQIKYGDLNNKKKNDIYLDLGVTGMKLIVKPIYFAANTVEEKDDDGKVIKTTKDLVVTWMPYSYGFTENYENNKTNKNIFEKINIDFEISDKTND